MFVKIQMLQQKYFSQIINFFTGYFPKTLPYFSIFNFQQILKLAIKFDIIILILQFCVVIYLLDPQASLYFKFQRYFPDYFSDDTILLIQLNIVVWTLLVPRHTTEHGTPLNLIVLKIPGMIFLNIMSSLSKT